jgi:8-oxo-dGTP pyrophosphatase MutT (NUDIX family)
MSTPLRQAAVLAVKDGLVCLVTSRNRRRWVLPKGHVEKARTPADTAAAEAWEEAGLKGIVADEPVGVYHYAKNGSRYAVTVHRMTVLTDSDRWPERFERDKEWVTFEEAARRVHEAELKEILAAAMSGIEVAVV